MAAPVPNTLEGSAERLLMALTAGDAGIRTAFCATLSRSVRNGALYPQTDRVRREEIEALTGLSEGFADAGSQEALDPVLRHLLARVL